MESDKSDTVTERISLQTDFKNCLQEANDCKADGNEHFRAGQWSEALVSYQSGLGRLPKRAVKLTSPGPTLDTSDSEDPPQPHDNETTEKPSDQDIDPDAEEYRKARAILHGNIGACYVKLGDHKQAVEACTQSLLDDPTYIKALQRRAACNENINSWSSLSAAEEDYKSLLKLGSPQVQTKDIETKLRFLRPRVEAAQKRETGEMLDKLKGLGNSLLGNFGLSTDNFKFEPNGQGGYSMNFSQ